MSAIDVDAGILRNTAAASAHAYEQTIKHVEAEITAANGALEPLIDTLTAQGPYAYTILPEVHPDGSVKLPILTTREEIADAYAMIRGASNLIEVVGVTEVRGAWYTFQDALSRGSLKGTDKVDVYETLGLFHRVVVQESPANSSGFACRRRRSAPRAHRARRWTIHC